MKVDSLRAILSLWGLQGAEVALLAQRENIVYQVEYNGKRFALKQHRQNFRTEAELHSELHWMAMLSEGGLSVPNPLLGLDGQFLQQFDELFFSVLHWIPGQPMGSTARPLLLDNPELTFHDLGQAMAKLHQLSDAWNHPQGFSRWRWDIDGLLGDKPLWGRFWENPSLSERQQHLFVCARDLALGNLQKGSFDFGLIHADLLRENVHVDKGDLHLLDFDDGGFGFRAFDVATSLLKNRHEPNYSQLHASLIQGYRQVRDLDTDQLNMFIALRALTYVGWIVPRLKEPGGQQRNERLIADADTVVSEWMNSGSC